MISLKRILIKLFWILLSLLLGLIIFIFIPIFPVDHVKLGDPADKSDARIEVPLENADIIQIMEVVRRGKFNSIYEKVILGSHLPLLNIRKSKVSHYYRNDGSEGNWPAIGDVVAKVGYGGGYGTDLHLEKSKGKWILVAHASWVY